MQISTFIDAVKSGIIASNGRIFLFSIRPMYKIK
jgi:hypothetical protein